MAHRHRDRDSHRRSLVVWENVSTLDLSVSVAGYARGHPVKNCLIDGLA